MNPRPFNHLSGRFSRRGLLRTALLTALGPVLAACGQTAMVDQLAGKTKDLSRQVGVGLAPTPSPGQPTPTPAPADLPAPDPVVQQYLAAWQAGRYADMYRLLSRAARAAVSEERFVGRHQAIASGITLLKLQITPGPPQIDRGGSGRPPTATVPLTSLWTTVRVGEIREETVLPLVYEENAWRVDWHPGVIFRGLTHETRVLLEPDDPPRGSIVDRNGQPLATQGRVLTVGLVAGKIKPGEEERVFAALASYLNLPVDLIRSRYRQAQPDWWVPLRDLPLSRRDEALARIGTLSGVVVDEKISRVYPHGPVAAHLIGYASPVTAEDLKKYPERGYEEGDLVGRTGIEAWADRELAGEKGGRLSIVSADGALVRLIAEKKARPGRHVQLTIDLALQKRCEEILGDKTGSIVVLDPRDNSIRALVSRPAFDPNLFVLGISDSEWQKLTEDPRRPFQHRPALSAYPTGSIFKVVTMSAGLEKGGFTPTTTFHCVGRWTGLGPRIVFGDWKPSGHGTLTLSSGLTQSCNIVFYEIGKKLNEIDPRLLPGFARQFGLGEPTGTVGLVEAEGTVPDPDWKEKTIKEPWYPGDAVNLAIGQGYLQATPLQMANLYSALAAGGRLRTPVVVQRLYEGEGQTVRTFQASERRPLPISPATLQAIREAMVRVTSSPEGTAYYAFHGYRLPVAGKTGSAENQNPDAHAWFAGFAPADQPEAVVIVMVEGGRTGAETAAPRARQVFEAIFGNRPA